MTKPTVVAALLFAFTIGTATAAGAQALGVKGGVNFSTIAVSPGGELGEVGQLPGVTAGAFITFNESSRLSFEVAGLLSMRRISFGPQVTDTLTYAEVPVVARYPVVSREGMAVRVIGGVVPAFRIAADEKVCGDVDCTSSSVKDAYKSIDVTVAIGAQAEWKQRWTIDVRYLLGVTDVYEITLGSERTRQRSLEVLVGYRLR